MIKHVAPSQTSCTSADIWRCHRALGHPPLKAREPKNVHVKTTRSSKWKTISAIFLLARTISGRLVRFNALKPCKACSQKRVRRSYLKDAPMSTRRHLPEQPIGAALQRATGHGAPMGWPWEGSTRRQMNPGLPKPLLQRFR